MTDSKQDFDAIFQIGWNAAKSGKSPKAAYKISKGSYPGRDEAFHEEALQQGFEAYEMSMMADDGMSY